MPEPTLTELSDALRASWAADDLTREQFRDGEVISGARPVHRPAGPPKWRNEAYQLMRQRVGERLATRLP
ncbi:MAG: hypothetical protein HOV79_15165 [Hamadaea sp.]|nr:hypothetical protein [Hamadaea sp.]